jgi:hypothetical protein
VTEGFTRDQFHRSPPLSLLACVSVGLFLASLIANALMTGGAAYPIPYNPIEQSRQYYAQFPEVMRVVSFLQLARQSRWACSRSSSSVDCCSIGSPWPASILR